MNTTDLVKHLLKAADEVNSDFTAPGYAALFREAADALIKIQPQQDAHHTPSPWTVMDKDYDRFGPTVWVEAANGHYVCELVRDADHSEFANANLIAAAPEMFELLKAASDLLYRAKRIIESSSSIPHLIEGNIEDIYWKIDDCLIEHKLSSYKPIAAKPEDPADTPMASDQHFDPSDLPEEG